jgi:hypothetical protein
MKERRTFMNVYFEHTLTLSCLYSCAYAYLYVSSHLPCYSNAPSARHLRHRMYGSQLSSNILLSYLFFLPL